jgi:cytoskeleton protein RodZ
MADNVDTSAASVADESVPAAPAPVVPPPTVGDALRAARLAQDLTVEQVAAELRIEPKQLAALEENRFEHIGVPVFVKGYIRQYGQRFGLNIDDLLAIYYRQGQLADVELQPNRAIRLRDDRQTSSWIVGALVAATVVVAVAAWWWNGGSFDAAPNAVEPATAPAAAPAAASREPPAVAVPSGGAPAVPPPAEAAPAASPEPAAAVAAPSAAEPAAAASAVAAPVETIPLEFRFAQESWAEVSDGRGERLLFGLNAAGRQVTVRGEPPFSILLGNADSVELRVNGSVYPIPSEGRQGSLARFSVDTAEE